MKNKNKYVSNDDDLEEGLDLNAIKNKYFIHWRWFVLALLVSFLAAFLYLRYTRPLYLASTTTLVKDEKKGGMLSELSAFSDLAGMGGMKNNVDNEVEILKSRTLIESTIKKLNLNIAFFIKGHIMDRELYKDSPISLHLSNISPEFYKAAIELKFLSLTPDTFELINEDEQESAKVFLGSKKVFHYGELIKTPFGELSIYKSKILKNHFVGENKEIRIEINPLKKVVKSFKDRLNVTSISKTSSIVEITIEDPVIKKAEEFLDNLAQIYNNKAVEDKNYISIKTSDFIASRLALVTKELDGVEQDVESFKKSNDLTDIESESRLYIEGSNEYDKKALETKVQLNVVESMVDFLKKSTKSDLLPTNIIEGGGDASGVINSYNQLVLDRNRLLKSGTIKNPAVVKIEQELTSLKSTVFSSLGRLQSTLKIKESEFSSNKADLNDKMRKIPAQERQFRAIARQQKVKEELYLYLLQKREETAISLSATEPNARIIDVAEAPDSPVSPIKGIAYMLAMLMGLFIPFGCIYILDLADTKIKSILDLEGKTKIPFLGDVPLTETPNKIMEFNCRNATTEALRIVRTNLDFMISNVAEEQAKTIFVTSTVPNEGKTFISVNLATTFAMTGKKVLLIGMDIRNPNLGEYFDLPKQGLTNYLNTKEAILNDFIVKQEGLDNFYVLPPGIIPPNPAELLMSPRVSELFKMLKTHFDYIIVDTAPVSLVTDTLIIAKLADCFVYVVRTNFLEKSMLKIANVLYAKKKLPNMCMVLNGTKIQKGYGYGYGHGYGYGEAVKKAPWYKKRWAAL